jgi:hypothetical protein
VTGSGIALEDPRHPHPQGPERPLAAVRGQLSDPPVSTLPPRAQ